MGNSFTCISPEEEQKKAGEGTSRTYVRRFSFPSFRRRTLLPSLSCSSSSSSSKKGGNAKKKKMRERHHNHHDHHHHAHEKDSLIQEQTLAATNLLFNQTPRNSNSNNIPFRRSTSVVYPSQPTGTGAGGGAAGQNTKKPVGGFVRSSSSRQRSS
ncbi:PREDICTED: putative methylesterase 13, chloroplastic, partial [Tarenaya hassleriana]|uniref:putative methylesterase 13, chloroplastic n=1 Tax=Tarenaya hassleriana TaxID=28532 RepID=UPI00053C3EDA